MKLNIDSGKLLYGLGVLFAAAALLYFVRDVVFGLSITVKAALLFVAFVGFFLAGATLDRDVLDVVAFALSGIAYVVFVGYVVVRYGPSETGTFVLLALSAGLFVLLGYAQRSGGLPLTRQRATGIAASLLVVSVVLVGADAVGGGVTYDLETADSITVEPVTTDEPVPYRETEQQVGTLTATNGFVFTRALSLPSLSGCLVGIEGLPRNDVWVSYEYPGYDRPDTIAGGATRQFAVRASVPVDVNRTEPVTYAIERGNDCEGTRERPTLLLETGEN